MTILGIGVDVVHVPRIAALLARRKPHRFALRILSPGELSQWDLLKGDSDCVRFLSVRWAVKEAAYKAMYPVAIPTWKELTYRGLDNTHQRLSKPCLVYAPLAREKSKQIGQTHVSVSHDGEYVYASVVVEGNLQDHP